MRRLSGSIEQWCAGRVRRGFGCTPAALRSIAGSVVLIGLVGAGFALASLSTAEPASATVSACDGLIWSGEAAGVQELWTANDDGDGLSGLTGAPTDPGDNHEPQWSPDGTRVVWFGHDETTWQIWVANADGTNMTKISTASAGADPTINIGPQWSPDGSRIAWTGDDGDTWQIWVANADGTNRSQISTVGAGVDPVENLQAQWSPDGSRIAWSGHDGDTWQIWVADADGTNRIEISTLGLSPDPVDSSRPQWSPDGTRIAWDGLAGDVRQIWVADATGAHRREISSVDGGPDPTSNANPQWSPNGRQIAWAGRDGVTRQIWVADNDGANRMELSSQGAGADPIDNDQPQWSPDGSRMAWTGVVGSVRHIWAANSRPRRPFAASPGFDRVQVSPSSTGLSNNHSAQWRPRFGEASLEVVNTPVISGQEATFTMTVNSSCSLGDVRIEFDIPACFQHDPVTFFFPLNSTLGHSTQNMVWSIPELNDRPAILPIPLPPVIPIEESLPIVGTVGPGACGIDPTVTGFLPAPSSPLPAPSPDQRESICLNLDDPFTDVPFTSFANLDISCIYSLGITTGTSATTYDPTGTVTREQMAAFLARLWRTLGDVCPSGESPFTDVSPTSFAKDDIDCLYSLGITTGTSATTYDPSGAVTREQMAAFLARLWRHHGDTCPLGGSPFTDVSPTSFAKDDIDCLYRIRVSSGTGGGKYDPGGSVTREQMAAFLGRFYRNHEVGFDLLPQ